MLESMQGLMLLMSNNKKKEKNVQKKTKQILKSLSLSRRRRRLECFKYHRIKSLSVDFHLNIAFMKQYFSIAWEIFTPLSSLADDVLK